MNHLLPSCELQFMEGETSSGGKGGHENPTGRATGVTSMRYHTQETQETSIDKKLL